MFTPQNATVRNKVEEGARKTEKGKGRKEGNEKREERSQRREAKEGGGGRGGGERREAEPREMFKKITWKTPLLHTCPLEVFFQNYYKKCLSHRGKNVKLKL